MWLLEFVASWVSLSLLEAFSGLVLTAPEDAEANIFTPSEVIFARFLEAK